MNARACLPSRRYLQLDEVTLYLVIGLAYLEDPEYYAGGNVATGRVCLAGQDEGERSDEETRKKCSLAQTHIPKCNHE
jgi:hypothetical protein